MARRGRLSTGNYGSAANTFSAGEDPESRYNLGNALARLERYEAAIDQYEQTLAAVPDHEDAAFNKALVERLLEEKQQQQANQDQEGEDAQQQPRTVSSPSRGVAAIPRKSRPHRNRENRRKNLRTLSNQQRRQKPRKAPTSRRRRRKVTNRATKTPKPLEQWLRRVPDDPGGLLRRKFQYETNQRLRTGELKRRQAEQIW